MRNFFFNWPQEVINLSCSLVYQFAVALLIDMMNDFVKVISFPPMKLLWLHNKQGTCKVLNLCDVSAEVLLCTRVAMGSGARC
jgi:hypothetical protein